MFKTRRTLAAEDAAQAALEKIWAKRRQVREPGAFLGWCDLVLLTEVLMNKRKSQKRDEREISESDLPPALAADSAPLRGEGGADPHDRAEQVEMRGQVRAAIRACLKNQQHAAVILGMYLEDKSLRQVADEVELSLDNTYKVRQRALKKLENCPEFIRVYEAWLK